MRLPRIVSSRKGIPIHGYWTTPGLLLCRSSQHGQRCLHSGSIALAARKPISIEFPSLDHTSNGIQPPATISSTDAGVIEYEPLPRSLSFRRGVLLLSVPVPPKHWPARIEMESELLSSTSAFLKGAEIAVNVVYDGTGDFKEIARKNETYPAKLYFGDGKVFNYPAFSLAMLGDQGFKRDVGYRPEGAALIPGMRGTSGLEPTQPEKSGREGHVEVYVCTHGSRDCRCADRGGPLVDALKSEVERRGLKGRVKIGEIAHVGGHK